MQHYPTDVIAQCVRWYLACSLNLPNLEDMMAERSITIDHSTLHRWRMDETYIRVRGQWKYLYRAVNTAWQTIDFLLTAKRDVGAALRFFRQTIRHHGEPEMVTIDKSGANTVALIILNADKPHEESITIRQNKYLNNPVEQDNRNIIRRTRQSRFFFGAKK